MTPDIPRPLPFYRHPAIQAMAALTALSILADIWLMFGQAP